MVTITLELPDDLYARLQAAADAAGETIEDYTVKLLTAILLGPTADSELTPTEQSAPLPPPQ